MQMAKKKRKHFIKLNNKIRELFDNSSFEDGVTTLSDDELLELVMLLRLDSITLDRESLIRALRRAWSEGEYIYRKSIVEHLSGKRDLSIGADKKEYTDKVDKILYILSGFDHSKEEEGEIISSFMESRANKITHQKIENRLKYIRRTKRIENIEQSLDAEIDSEYRLSFMHSFIFEMDDEDFLKNLLCLSSAVDFDKLWNQTDEYIISYLKEHKARTINEKQKIIEMFLNGYRSLSNPLLDHDSFKYILKRMRPEENPCCASLNIGTLEKIFRNINGNIHLYDTENHILVQEFKIYKLFKEEISYTVSVSYDKELIYCGIWNNTIPEFDIDIEHKRLELESALESNIKHLIDQMKEISKNLEIQQATYEDFIVNFASAQIQNSATLKLRDKNMRRVLFHFKEYISPLLEQKEREELLAKSIRDFKSLFPLARSLKRKIVFHVGPTNSGKTYLAMKELAEATTGYYLAPLRLLALEGYETLRSSNVSSSLITGEEEIIDDESTHISSTIEMMNHLVDVDVCVIDEIQMINDRDRGWAWANALIGAPAKKIILTGSADALGAIKSLCDYLQEDLEIIEFERKNSLYLDSMPTPLKKVKPQTAIIAFSRRDVLALKQKLSSRHDVSVIYGNLSPEIRREEARRFRDGVSTVLVATDAIAMGLNLPIKHIVFFKDNKFDGLRRRDLLPSEVLQISGRAGRYGLEESGHVGAINSSMLENISSIFNTKITDIELPVSVMANMEHVVLISEILKSNNISKVLGFFAENMEFDGPFVAANMDSMLEIASIVDNYDIDIETKYHLSCAPASISSPYIESVFNRYIKQIEAGIEVHYIPPRELPSFAQTNEMLLNAEDRVREISLYLWLSFKFPDFFKDSNEAIEARHKLNSFIENSLRNANFTKQCKKCGKILDFTNRYALCDGCFNKHKRGYRRVRKR